MLFRSDRKSTRLNSSHTIISYAVFCLKKKKRRSEEHTSELQSHDNIVCRLLLETKIMLATELVIDMSTVSPPTWTTAPSTFLWIMNWCIVSRAGISSISFFLLVRVPRGNAVLPPGLLFL